MIESQRILTQPFRVSKTALGRGLGTLMSERKPAEKPEPGTEKKTSAGNVAVQRGVGSFLNGVRDDGHQTATNRIADRVIPAPAPQTTPQATLKRLPKWPFIVADAVLVAVALALLILSRRPIPQITLFFATLAIILGAGICTIPFVVSPKPSGRKVEVEKPHPKLRIMLH